MHRLHERRVRLQQKLQSSGKLVAWAFEQNNMEELKRAVEQGYRVNIHHFPKYSEAAWGICKKNVRYLVNTQCDSNERIVHASS